MTGQQAEVVVAGHICLDIIPAFYPRSGGLAELLVPGKLVDTGPATVSTGGAVSNTGMALHRLGIATSLMGKVGDDYFGDAILSVVRHQSPELAQGMIVAQGEASSYSVVINPPGVDRIFLHCPGCNNTYGAEDVDPARLAGAKLFHFGYPPLMRRMFEDGGRELAAMLQRVKAQGLTTSLDMARPDPASPAGQANWVEILERALPFVDIFPPSIEEILYMLDRPRYDRMIAEYGPEGIIDHTSRELLGELADRLFALGVAIVVIKLGEHGIYLRVTPDAARLAAMGPATPPAPAAWLGRELVAGCFKVQVKGTTGAGDCTIAGFLAGLLRGLTPEGAAELATAVGACSVEAPDATSGVPHLSVVTARIAQGWPRLTPGD